MADKAHGRQTSAEHPHQSSTCYATLARSVVPDWAWNRHGMSTRQMAAGGKGETSWLQPTLIDSPAALRVYDQRCSRKRSSVESSGSGLAIKQLSGHGEQR